MIGYHLNEAHDDQESCESLQSIDQPHAIHKNPPTKSRVLETTRITDFKMNYAREETCNLPGPEVYTLTYRAETGIVHTMPMTILRYKQTRMYTAKPWGKNKYLLCIIMECATMPRRLRKSNSLISCLERRREG